MRISRKDKAEIAALVVEIIESKHDEMSITEAANFMGYEVSYLYKLVERKQIPFSKARGRLVFHRHELENLRKKK